METEIISIDDVRLRTGALAKAGGIIRGGGLVAFPTETVYGLGANGLDAAACAGIYQAKGRPSDNPLILHIADLSMLDMVAREVPPLARKLLEKFTPGPLTVILPKQPAVPDSVTGGLDTVGVRLPANEVARAMIRAAGVPVAAPSANISGRPSPTTAQAVAADMQGRIPLILDGGPCIYGVESTIIDCSGGEVVILRPGGVTREQLEAVAGTVSLDPALVGADTVPRAPGMKYRHYAPESPLTLVTGEAAALEARFLTELKLRRQAEKKVGVIVSEELAERLGGLVPPELVFCFGPRGDYAAMAARLYEALRYFDGRGADCLLGEGTGEEGLGLAVMNRLGKASGFDIIRA